MDAASFTTPAFMTLPNSLSSPEYSTPEPTTIKMEDLQKPQLPLSPPPESHRSSDNDCHPSPSETGSPPAHSDSKPTKKRKSWGQVLPEPKTSLPPRKRAKTEDEKEQRRIERVKRNRLAAHNSRERKRQEVELLLDEKKLLEDRVHELEAVVRSYRLQAPHLKIEDLKLGPETPRASLSSSTPSHIDDASSTIVDPKTTSFTSMTPSTSPSLRSIDTPSYSESMPATPVEFQEATVALSDETQHSAVSVGFGQSSAFFGKNSSFPCGDPHAYYAQSATPDPQDPFAQFLDLTYTTYDDTLDLLNDQDNYTNTFLVDAFPGHGPLDCPDGLEKNLGLHADSGATTIVSDETGIADSI